MADGKKSTSSPESKTDNSRGLVRKLLDNPQLPAYIASLEAPVLDRLIRHIGVEDAQELVALASPAQMQELVEIETWANEHPGEAESFEPGKFLEWVDLWREMGAGFMTERLVELGEEPFVLALQHFAAVVNMEEAGISGAVDNFGKYAVLSKDEANWPVLLNVLTQVWAEDPDFLTRVLGRSSFQRSVLVQDSTEMDTERVLHHDLAYDRDRRLEGKGYVTPLSATLFLSGAKNAGIDELLIQVGYDVSTRGHLEIAGSETEKGQVASPAGDAETEAGVTSDTEVVPVSPERDENWQALDRLLKQEKIVPAAPSGKLLAGPSRAHELYVKRVLKALGDRDPVALQERLDEIVYLANVLVSGSAVQGGEFTEEEAAKAVHATCNLGLEYCLFEDPWDDEASVLKSFTDGEPGMVKAFRIGYHLISQLPQKAIVAIVRELTSTAAQRRLHGHPWVREQVAKAFGRIDVQGNLDEQALEEVRDILETLSLVFDNDTCHQLRAFCDAFPCFPRSLEPGAAPRIHVDKRMRYISTPADLRRILARLEALRI